MKIPPPEDRAFWNHVRAVADAEGYDGCSGVPDFHLECCLRHDHHYRHGCDIDGTPVTRAEADAAFRACIQSRSKLGVASPMSWWRWVGVRIFGRRRWMKDKD